MVLTRSQISDYNKPPAEKSPIRNLFQVIAKQILLQGFLVGNKDFGPAYFEEHQKTVQEWLRDGKILAKLSITEGIENAAEGLVGILKGENFGKAVLKVR